MTQDEIIIRKGIVHILDAELGYPVFSEELLDLSPDTNDFFRGLIYKIMSGDEMKKCFFDGFEESSEFTEESGAAETEEMPWESDGADPDKQTGESAESVDFLMEAGGVEAERVLCADGCLCPCEGVF